MGDIYRASRCIVGGLSFVLGGFGIGSSVRVDFLSIFSLFLGCIVCMSVWWLFVLSIIFG